MLFACKLDVNLPSILFTLFLASSVFFSLLQEYYDKRRHP